MSLFKDIIVETKGINRSQIGRSRRRNAMLPGKVQSSKRNRPHVPLENRKRTVQACIQCRTSKKKCQPGPRNQCASCARSRQACVFESIPPRQHETQRESPKVTNSPQDDLFRWANMANDISARFNEICPGNALDPNHFSIISGLFREAVAGQGQRLDLSHDASDHETTSPRSGVGRQISLRIQLLIDLAARTRNVDFRARLFDCGV